jgi:hypothetical protein
MARNKDLCKEPKPKSRPTFKFRARIMASPRRTQLHARTSRHFLMPPHSPHSSPPLTPAPEPREDRILYLPRPPYTIINDHSFHQNVSRSITSYILRHITNRDQEQAFIKAYFQLSPHTIVPTSIFVDYSQERSAVWYVTRRAAARAAEKLAGYVSRGLRTALEAVPSVTTKIASFSHMEEKMFYGPISQEGPYKGNYQCFVSVAPFPCIIDHPDKLRHMSPDSPILSTSSISDISPPRTEVDPYVPHSPTPSPPPAPIDVSPSPPPMEDPNLPLRLPSPPPSPPPRPAPANEPPPLPGFWLNTEDSADYYPMMIPNDTRPLVTQRAKYIKYDGGSSPRVLGTMGPKQPVYAEPLYLPPPPVHNPLVLTPAQRQQLLFASDLEKEIDKAVDEMGELPLRAEIDRLRWANVAVSTNLTLVNKYQQRFQEAVSRREASIARLEHHRIWERLDTFLPKRIPPPRSPTNPPPALTLLGLTSRPTIRTELPQLQEEPSSHAAQNQSSSTPSSSSSLRVQGRRKSKGKKRKTSYSYGQDPNKTPLICNMCGTEGHLRANCPNNTEARTRCDTCGKLGHYTQSCYKLRYCTYCHHWGHTGVACTDPHRDCSINFPCPVPRSHRYYDCPIDRKDPNDGFDYEGAADYARGDQWDWEAQDHSS